MLKRTPTHPKGIDMSTGSTGTERFKEATEALFEGDAETAAQRFAAATAEIAEARSAIDTTGIVRAATERALREIEGRPAVAQLLKNYPEFKDPDLAQLADRRVLRYEAEGLSRAKAVERAGDEIAQKFKLGRFGKETPQPTSQRSSSAEESESDETAEASKIIAEIASARAASQSEVPRGQQSAGAYDGLAVEHRRQLAWRKLRRGNDL